MTIRDVEGSEPVGESDQVALDVLEPAVRQLREKQHRLEARLAAQHEALHAALDAKHVLELALTVATLADAQLARAAVRQGVDTTAPGWAVDYRRGALAGGVSKAIEYLAAVAMLEPGR